MRFLPWAAFLVAGTLAGMSVCAAFVVPRRFLAWTGLAGTLATVLLVCAVIEVWTLSGRPDAAIASPFIAIGAVVGGYALASTLVPAFTRPRPDRSMLSGVAPDSGIAVVVLADAEDERYSPSSVTANLDRYEHADVPLPPYAARPFFYASERSRYRVSGGSPARAAVREIASTLATRLRDDGVAQIVEVAFCDGSPSAAEVIAAVAQRFGPRIVVADLTAARTSAFDVALARVHALAPASGPLVIETTEPLWASPMVAARAAERALSAFGDSGIADGVVLVAMGNPWQVDRLYPTAMEQTTYLAQRIRAELIEGGLPAERVRQAWLEWEEPDVPEAVRHLGALGAKQVAMVPVDLLYASLATAVDLPLSVDRATTESDVRIAVVDPLGDDPAIIAALRRSVVEAARRLQAPAPEV